MAAYPMTLPLPGTAVSGTRLAARPMDEFTSDLVAARVTIAHMARWARRHLLAQRHTLGGADACCCPGSRCTLAEVPGGEQACRLARELAWLSLEDAPATARPDGKPEQVALQYLGALRSAENAVSYCQRIQHVLGECWFSAPGEPGGGLCARTLATAQLLSVARRVL